MSGEETYDRPFRLVLWGRWLPARDAGDAVEIAIERGEAGIAERGRCRHQRFRVAQCRICGPEIERLQESTLLSPWQTSAREPEDGCERRRDIDDWQPVMSLRGEHVGGLV